MLSAEKPYSVLQAPATAPAFLRQRYQEWVLCGPVSTANAVYAVILGAVELLFAGLDVLAERLQFLEGLQGLRERARREPPDSVLRNCAVELQQSSQRVILGESAMMSVKEFGGFDEIPEYEVSLFRRLSQSIACKVAVFTSGSKLTCVPQSLSQAPVIRIYRESYGSEPSYYLLHTDYLYSPCAKDLRLPSQYHPQSSAAQCVAIEETSRVLMKLTKSMQKICPQIMPHCQNDERLMSKLEVLESYRKRIELLASSKEYELLQTANEAMRSLSLEANSSLRQREPSEGIQNREFYRDDVSESGDSTRASSYNSSIAPSFDPPTAPPISNLVIRPPSLPEVCAQHCQICHRHCSSQVLKPCGPQGASCLDCVNRWSQLNTRNCPFCSSPIHRSITQTIDKYSRWYSINDVVEKLQDVPSYSYCKNCGEILCTHDISGRRLQHPSCPNCEETR